MARGQGARAESVEAEERRRLVHRLSRIEGQVAALRDRIEAGPVTGDLLVQVAAVRGALAQFTARALEQYLVQRAPGGGSATARGGDELARVLRSLLRQS